MLSDRVEKSARSATKGAPAGAPFYTYERSTQRCQSLFCHLKIKSTSQKVEKELSIPDLDYAERILKEIGYFGLIGGYKEPFKNPTTKSTEKMSVLKISSHCINSMKTCGNCCLSTYSR